MGSYTSFSPLRVLMVENVILRMAYHSSIRSRGYRSPICLDVTLLSCMRCGRLFGRFRSHLAELGSVQEGKRRQTHRINGGLQCRINHRCEIVLMGVLNQRRVFAQLVCIPLIGTDAPEIPEC